MLNVGDKVKVQFTQSVNLGGTALPPTTVEGKIVEDKGEFWLVELALSFNGKNRIAVPKTAALAAV